MATSKDFIGYGLNPYLSRLLGLDGVNVALTGAGTTQADATPITQQLSVFTTVGSGTGALLPPSGGKPVYAVVNSGANTLSVYPSGTEKINNGTAGAAVSVTAGVRRVFYPSNTGWIVGF